MKHALTIDVEDYFQVSAFEKHIPSDHWDHLAPRIERNMDRVLQSLSEHNSKATFFTLGWVAKRFPHIIHKIISEGHELASHGTMHQRASDQDYKCFQSDIGDAKRLLEDLSGQPVLGYRAPSFSFTKDNVWVYDALALEGYTYSSSVYPIAHDHYGIPDAPRSKYVTQSGITEIPLSTLSLFGRNIPISGGGYFRLYPYMLTKWLIRNYEKQTQQPYVFYIHPWEFDPDQPRIDQINLKTQFRHYINLKRVRRRFRSLLADFQWSTMVDVYQLDAPSNYDFPVMRGTLN